jgi:clan AA aspartic protease (TIGR02281 family)
MKPMFLIAAALAAVSPTIASACDDVSASMPTAAISCSNPNTVRLTSKDGWRSMNIWVDLGEGVRPYPFVLDTGATSISVTQATAGNLMHDGQADLGPNGVVTLADGSRRITQTIVIHEVTVANRTANNVHAVVVPDGTEMLLGMSVLSAIGVSVDLTSHTLHAPRGGPPPNPELHEPPVDKAFRDCMKAAGATYASCHYYVFGTK